MLSVKFAASLGVREAGRPSASSVHDRVSEGPPPPTVAATEMPWQEPTEEGAKSWTTGDAGLAGAPARMENAASRTRT